MRILLGLTGSVASVLATKLVEEFKQVFGNVEVVASDNALKFFYSKDVSAPVYKDTDEWVWEDRNQWEKDDPILHIELRKWASALVIAPISANKLAEMAHGLCPDLLTSVALAWDYCRPIVIAPAMNSFMWEHSATVKNIEILRSWGVHVVNPVRKKLACGDDGVGAMAPISDIVNLTKRLLRWYYPLSICGNTGIPVSHHPGAFGFHRKHSHHTGVDLYCNDGSEVSAVESGRVINIEHFTGVQDESPWWENTESILIEGPAGVVCYGEIEPSPYLNIGSRVKSGQHVGRVKRVLKEGKERPDIPGHRLSMLHLELYPYGVLTCSKSWKLEEHGVMCCRPENLLDTTPLLIDAYYSHPVRLTM